MSLTPEQFNKLVTKEEFDQGINDAKKEIVEEIRGDISKVLDVVDGIAKKFNDHDIENISNNAAHGRFEKRITKLEKHAEIKTAI